LDWKFAQHPRFGIGTGLTIAEDGYMLVKDLGSQHSLCMADTPIGPGGVYYWEFEIVQFTSGINFGVLIEEQYNAGCIFIS
jgi:hypothetical protein